MSFKESPNGVDDTLKQRILELAAPVLDERGLEVWDIERVGQVLKVTLDRLDDAVGIEDCAAVSRFLSHALDVEDPIPGAYRLEVSSPGMDRRLRGLDDFRRFSGKLCRIKLRHAENGDYLAIGRIHGADDERITLEGPKGALREVDIDNMAEARLEVEF